MYIFSGEGIYILEMGSIVGNCEWLNLVTVKAHGEVCSVIHELDDDGQRDNYNDFVISFNLLRRYSSNWPRFFLWNQGDPKLNYAYSA